ncbi:5'/3'-nucleotidase SurE [Telmatocola sphagniphila]|uniref:5'-nucleotidase SurE n=1 Tax=Telmatocola sphagniphila TaxID=1123043 RepID=A0A8E6B4X8_9BACT|nr:5'/3'-nucleotidase SurE [Telmatocola sphagniphila]QVL32023.1 5'/3'-nucleotidase SurE [Telmatocola sphagniphila]
MKILLTNDDGIYAPGLRALRKELQSFGDVIVVAPAVEQSAAGHSVTLLHPLVVAEVFDESNQFLGWAVEGRPADCVKLALLELLPDPPDLIVSGMNHGSNAGINVLYSGTVAAAVEGAFFRKTAIAISLASKKAKPSEFAEASKFAVKVIRQIVDTQPQAGMLYNLNLPAPELGEIKGVKILPQNVAPYTENFHRRTDPRGRVYFWMGNDYGCPDPHPGTDESALSEGYLVITPLQFDLTNRVELQRLKQHFE